MHTRFFYFIICLIALFLWTVFYWATEPSQSQIDEYFEIVEGQPDGPYHQIEIYHPVLIDDIPWTKYDEDSALIALKNQFQGNYPTYKEERKNLTEEIWNSILTKEKEKYSTEMTWFKGDSVKISTNNMDYKFLIMKIKDRNEIFSFPDRVISNLYQFKYEKEIQGLEEFTKVQVLDSILEGIDNLAIKYLKRDSAENRIRIYEIEIDGNLAYKNKSAFESLETTLEYDDEFNDYMEVDDKRYKVWYSQWNYKMWAWIMIFFAVINLIGFLKMSTRSPKNLIKLIPDEESLKWKIVQKQYSSNEKAIQKSALEIKILAKQRESEELDILGIVFLDTENDLLYHYNARDYLVASMLIDQLQLNYKERVLLIEVVSYSEIVRESGAISHSYRMENGEDLVFESL